jgi:hypothetical protein
MIVEVQYATELFSCFKIAVDIGDLPYILHTSIQTFKLMELEEKSFSGGIAILNMYAF